MEKLKDSKEFMDNYKENSLKVLELINSSKKNERERDTDDNRNNINQAFSEVYDIVNHIEKIYIIRFQKILLRC